MSATYAGRVTLHGALLDQARATHPELSDAELLNRALQALLAPTGPPPAGVEVLDSPDAVTVRVTGPAAEALRTIARGAPMGLAGVLEAVLHRLAAARREHLAASPWVVPPVEGA